MAIAESLKSIEALPHQPRADHVSVLTPPGRRRSDSDLQLVRRIDWRFLLPDPQLRRVAYLGPGEGTLLTALQRFSESVEIFSSDSQAAQLLGRQCHFDFAVLRWRRWADLEAAYKLLAPNGYLYWEIERSSWRDIISRGETSRRDKEHRSLQNIKKRKNRWRRSLGLVRHCLTAAERLGLDHIEIHWHRPNFEAGLEIIPMHDPAALNYAFSRPRSDLASRLKLASGRYMLKAGLLSRLVPCFSLTGRKPSASAESK
jgi:hypothetical protein